MLALYREIARVRAQDQLDAAEASAFPHMGQYAERWLESIRSIARGWLVPGRGAERRPSTDGAPFTIDGLPVGFYGIAQGFRRMFGRGFRE
jgi:hypothetical protein